MQNFGDLKKNHLRGLHSPEILDEVGQNGIDQANLSIFVPYIDPYQGNHGIYFAQ